ncbi:MAG: hypothetical protein GY801_09915 [bacterium]|nr:hypothetical protein [bacterium]
MKRSIIHLLALVMCCTVVPSISAQNRKPGMQKVGLYNKVTKEIKSDCIESMGKHDYKPSYECRDDNKKKFVPFDLGADWKPVSISPVCMKNRVDGVVKNDCVKYESGKDGGVTYRYLNEETGKLVGLDEQWEPLPLDDPMCKSLKFREDGDDPIKYFDFDIISDLEESAEKESER